MLQQQQQGMGGAELVTTRWLATCTSLVFPARDPRWHENLCQVCERAHRPEPYDATLLLAHTEHVLCVYLQVHIYMDKQLWVYI